MKNIHHNIIVGGVGGNMEEDKMKEHFELINQNIEQYLGERVLVVSMKR